MPCYHPLHGYKSRTVNPLTGKRSVTFRASEGFIDLPVTVSCGQCSGCRKERSRQWAVRCVHEAQLHEDNSFVTLTYDDANLPYGGTLIKKHFQDFMKRVRRRYPKEKHGKIQYFHCGEYGGRGRRPHYHALLFGLSFPDCVLFKKSHDGSSVFTSAILQDLWGLGFTTVGAVSFASAAYVARYVMKKVTGDAAVEHYKSIDPETGEISRLLAEYVTMSLKPAIAKDWYSAFSSDVYPDDFVVIQGKRMKPPKYYDKQLEKADLEAHAELKSGRAAYAATQRENATPERLAVREACHLAKIVTLKRELE